ncbi:fkbM_fam, methyltransferase, FkbM family [Candidatus Methylopumilus planktonicus]|uniref:FkbM family methyltransferase n=1 Tax=Candidatus Methylopumilus planktonicus TaxID=1581557 RepID=UPI003BEF05A6
MEGIFEKFYGEKEVDKSIREIFFADYSYHGTFLEVGAAGPEFLSMSKHYRENGWRVIAVEPNPDFCKLHHQIGYEVLQYACGDHDEDNVEFFVVDSQSADYLGGKISYESFSSLGIKEPYRNLKKNISQRKIIVKLRRLDTILNTHTPNVEQIDILSVDVEGWELEVLDGLNISKYRPRVIIIENLFSENHYLSYLKAKDYILWKRAHPNDVFIRSDMILNPIKRLWLYIYSAALYLFNMKGKSSWK